MRIIIGIDNVDAILENADIDIIEIIDEVSKTVVVGGKEYCIKPDYDSVYTELKLCIEDEFEDDDTIVFTEDVEVYLMNTVVEYVDDIGWQTLPKKKYTDNTFVNVDKVDKILFNKEVPFNFANVVAEVATPVIVGEKDFYPKPSYTKVCDRLKSEIANRLRCGGSYKFTPWANSLVTGYVEYNLDEKFAWDFAEN